MKWYHTTVFTCVSWVRFLYPQLFLYAILLLFERRADMERRTQPRYEYHSCDFMDDGVYIDMNLLREYEDTGFTPEQVMELKERDTAKEPIDIEDNYGFFVCPSCGNSIYASDDFESHKFCLNCGQRIQWRE